MSRTQVGRMCPRWQMRALKAAERGINRYGGRMESLEGYAQVRGDASPLV